MVPMRVQSLEVEATHETFGHCCGQECPRAGVSELAQFALADSENGIHWTPAVV